ncbi:hypothetical protein [Streptosporangium carneum]|uniref:Uncharacterized protein n=1 Tax=Streptosporangium carneum TaxID=47481 RepID=A0A9W6I9S8_9ACTN|nr:hypothetical protein [Streptosporangium carneum]GLK13793.1 hypothetical protein GCM10017600_72040 [Streptosporangium carneum]
MLKSKTRRRVAAKTAAIGVVSAGLLFGAVPAIASLAAAPKPVSYTCTSVSGVAAASPYKLLMDVSGPLTSTPGSTIVVTWKLGQPAASPSLGVPAAIAVGDRLVVEAEVAISGSPVPSSTGNREVTGTSTPGAVASGVAPTLPSVLITLTPTATGVVAVRPDAFTLVHQQAAGTGVGSSLYDCTVANPAEASAAALTITVNTSGAGTGTPGTSTPTSTSTSTGTPTPTPTYTTPEPTVTVTQTKTSKPRKTTQIDKTPGGGAATGGGGEAGPDARMIMFGGAMMAAAAGIGGLMLRRRTATRG